MVSQSPRSPPPPPVSLSNGLKLHKAVTRHSQGTLARARDQRPHRQKVELGPYTGWSPSDLLAADVWDAPYGVDHTGNGEGQRKGGGGASFELGEVGWRGLETGLS